MTSYILEPIKKCWDLLFRPIVINVDHWSYMDPQLVMTRDLDKVQDSDWAFDEKDKVRKKSGSWWEGNVVGFYSTEQTPKGYCVQLDKPYGPVQLYPEAALEKVE